MASVSMGMNVNGVHYTEEQVESIVRWWAQAGNECGCELCLYRRGAAIVDAAEQGITVEQAVDRKVKAERK